MAKGCVNIPVLAVTAALMGRPRVTLDNWAGSKDSAQLGISSKICLKMAFWPPGMCYQATVDPSRGKLVKVGMWLQVGTLGLHLKEDGACWRWF